MVNEFKNQVKSEINRHPLWEKINGVGFVVFGILALIAQVTRIPLVWGIALIGMGLVFLAGGWNYSYPVYVYLGSLLEGLGIALIFLLLPANITLQTLGSGLLVMSVGFLAASIFVYLRFRLIFWWSLFPVAVFGGSAIVFLFTNRMWSDFVFWIAIFLGFAFLLSGEYLKLLGLVIPGSLISSLGLGVHFAFANSSSSSLISNVGVLLVWFAVGWGAIPLLSRKWSSSLIWWPLIPAGVIGVVGLGLLIGGDPDNAAFFIGNTSAVFFIVSGLYLILLRRGMHT